MFEGQLTSVLNRLLSAYVHGITAKDLSVGVFKGDVTLRNLRLKTEALNAMNLPFKVQSGVVGRLSLEVPWRNLGKQPVIVKIEELYIVAGFSEPDADLTVEERTARWKAAAAELKRRLVDEGEAAWLLSSEGADSNGGGGGGDKNNTAGDAGDGWIAGMLDTILGNLVVQVSRIHLRLEGDLGAPNSGGNNTGQTSSSSSSSSSSSKSPNLLLLQTSEPPNLLLLVQPPHTTADGDLRGRRDQAD
eukprot:CAMPEP_0197592888 /NCGR_PEP_ID=MMETSP1326-20131121/16295_1 /TAXON_ID=1155430 /ORGANISM="Genus nov. species nov., Strain RCC2288" /LENGTH=245 /DNA_ID=CAMNT_0043158697 /DNA_START=83 /DNA_END=817 /DNA_ORIENTATION=-